MLISLYYKLMNISRRKNDMELSGTKKKILDISLDLFSKYGYASVSMEQIAAAVGIKAPFIQALQRQTGYFQFHI
mgnify:CR=1 FL=1